MKLSRVLYLAEGKFKKYLNYVTDLLRSTDISIFYEKLVFFDIKKDRQKFHFVTGFLSKIGSRSLCIKVVSKCTTKNLYMNQILL